MDGLIEREVLVEPAELAELIRGSGDQPVVLLDVRWALGDRHGHADYLEGHLPGAVYVDLEGELASPPSAGAGRHPLPAVADLQRAARRWGLHRSSRVVVYDAVGGTSAARAWWLLRWAGLERVQILDGGLPAWRAAGLPVEAGEVDPAPGDVVLGSGQLPVVDADEVARLAGAPQTVVLDARAAERYRGEVEPVDPVAGHIPGAVSAPTTQALDGDGRFLPAPVLRQWFTGLGVRPGVRLVCHCGSGVTAAHLVAALAVAGFGTAALYPGSWSQWCHDQRRPVATGERP